MLLYFSVSWWLWRWWISPPYSCGFSLDFISYMWYQSKNHHVCLFSAAFCSWGTCAEFQASPLWKIISSWRCLSFSAVDYFSFLVVAKEHWLPSTNHARVWRQIANCHSRTFWRVAQKSDFCEKRWQIYCWFSLTVKRWLMCVSCLHVRVSVNLLVESCICTGIIGVL